MGQRKMNVPVSLRIGMQNVNFIVVTHLPTYLPTYPPAKPLANPPTDLPTYPRSFPERERYRKVITAPPQQGGVGFGHVH